MRNHSYVYHLHVHSHANQSHFHLNGFARKLVLKLRQFKATRKWPIRVPSIVSYHVRQVNDLTIAHATSVWGCVPLEWSRSGSVTQYHPDYGASKESMGKDSTVPLMHLNRNVLESLMLIPIIPNERTLTRAWRFSYFSVIKTGTTKLGTVIAHHSSGLVCVLTYWAHFLLLWLLWQLYFSQVMQVNNVLYWL